MKPELDQNQSFHPASADGKISVKEKAGYSLGDLACNLVVVAVSSFLTYYYTDVIGVSAGIIGTIILLSRFLDGVTDLGMGVLIDKTKSRHGKARPWILWMAIPFAVVTTLVFSVPENWGTTATLIYIAVTYNLLFFVYTAINVPYGTLNSLITQDQNQRSDLNIFRMSAGQITTLLVSTFTLPLVNFFGGGAGSWQLTFGAFSVITIFLFYITFHSTTERVAPSTMTQGLGEVPFTKALSSLLKNKYWILIVLIAVSTFLFQGSVTGITIYYAENILGDANMVGTLTISLTLPTLITIMTMSPIVKRIGKRNSMLVGICFIIIGSAFVFINPASATVAIIASIIRGIGFAPLLGTVFAMMADTIEYGEWKTGVRTEGMVYSGGSFGTKVGGGLGSASVGWVLAIGGYVSGSNAEQPTSAFTAIEFMFSFFPIIVALLMAVFLSFYKLDKEYPKIIQELNTTRQ